MNDQCVYIHFNPITAQPIYVGMGVIKRAHDFSNRNSKWKKIKAKFGKPIVAIIGIDMSIENAAQAERKLIKFYGLENLANYSPGGDNLIGFTHSEESRKKISNFHKGRAKSPETRRKMSEAKKGIVFSDEHRKNLSASQSGEKHHNFGKTLSKETKDKMKIAATGENSHVADKNYYDFRHAAHGVKRCRQYELRKEYNLDQAALRRVVIGQARQHKGWEIVR